MAMFKDISFKQVAFCGSYGLALWIGAMLLIRAIGPMGAFSGIGLIVSFVAVIPATLPAVLLTKRVMGPSRGNMLVGVTIISTIALLLAGICFSFFPSLYAADIPTLLAAAGFMLWGGGVGFALALIVGED
jgi:hypothetical protein